MLNNIKNGPFNPSKSHVVHKITLICAHLRPSFCTYRHVSPNSLKKTKVPSLALEDSLVSQRGRFHEVLKATSQNQTNWPLKCEPSEVGNDSFMFCAYNDYLHITAKTLPSYRIKDDSDIASSTCRNPRYCSLIFVVRTDKGRTINSASTTCKIGNSVCKFYFLQTELQTELQTIIYITTCVSR